MNDKLINHFLEKHKECFNRFTFDKIFRFLLSNNFDSDEATSIILNHCLLSALVYQERIENIYYKKISTAEKISSDLTELTIYIIRKDVLNTN